jgi:hypothetical protein
MFSLIGRDFFGSIRRAFVAHRQSPRMQRQAIPGRLPDHLKNRFRTRVLMIGRTATSLRLPGGTVFPRLEEIPIVDRSSFARASARRIARMRRSQECAVDAESSFAAMTKAIARALLAACVPGVDFRKLELPQTRCVRLQIEQTSSQFGHRGNDGRQGRPQMRLVRGPPIFIRRVPRAARSFPLCRRKRHRSAARAARATRAS